MTYNSMSFQRFPAYRDGFRRLMAQKDLADIRAARSVLYKLKDMTPQQIQLLIDDMRLLEEYRMKNGTTSKEWFMNFMEGQWPKIA